MKKRPFLLTIFLAVVLAGLWMLSACTAQANLLISSKPRLAASAPQTDLRELVAGNNAFAFDLYSQLKQGEGNLFFSPYSISQALAMVYGGGRGETARQMAEVLHFSLPQERLHPAMNSLALSLEERSQVEPGEATPEATPEPAFELNVANSVWGQKGLPFLPTYLDLLAQNYGAGLKTVDFRRAPDAAVKEINAWVNEQTKGRIPVIIQELTRDTALVLANAIYFNGKWEIPFDEEKTKSEPFYKLDGETTDGPLMHQTANFSYTQGEGYQAIELPYANPEFSMVVVLPAEGQFSEIEGKVDSEWVQGIVNRMQTHEVILTMPKFRFETPTISLKNTLSEMGMTDAFSRNADFFGIIEQQPDLKMAIGEVLHKAFIDVNEEKTEAAAVTVVIITVEVEFGSEKPEPIIMRIDRPFIFFIRDSKTSTILFLGRVMNPAE